MQEGQRANGLTEPSGSNPSESTEDPSEMALVGEAAVGGDGGERPVRLAQPFAGGTDLHAMPVLAGCLAFDPAEYAGQVDGMDSGFAGQVAYAKRDAEFVAKTVLDSAKPERRVRFGPLEAGERAEEFEKVSFHLVTSNVSIEGLTIERTRGARSECGI